MISVPICVATVEYANALTLSISRNNSDDTATPSPASTEYAITLTLCTCSSASVKMFASCRHAVGAHRVSVVANTPRLVDQRVDTLFPVQASSEYCRSLRLSWLRLPRESLSFRRGGLPLTRRRKRQQTVRSGSSVMHKLANRAHRSCV